MNRLPIISRLAVIVTGLTGALLALSTGAASAACAAVRAPLGGDPHGRPGLPSGHPAAPAAHTVVIGGMPGWQIALLAAGAALAAAAVAILVARAWAARKAHVTAA